MLSVTLLAILTILTTNLITMKNNIQKGKQLHLVGKIKQCEDNHKHLAKKSTYLQKTIVTH